MKLITTIFFSFIFLNLFSMEEGEVNDNSIASEEEKSNSTELTKIFANFEQAMKENKRDEQIELLDQFDKKMEEDFQLKTNILKNSSASSKDISQMYDQLKTQNKNITDFETIADQLKDFPFNFVVKRIALRPRIFDKILTQCESDFNEEGKSPPKLKRNNSGIFKWLHKTNEPENCNTNYETENTQRFAEEKEVITDPDIINLIIKNLPLPLDLPLSNNFVEERFVFEINEFNQVLQDYTKDLKLQQEASRPQLKRTTSLKKASKTNEYKQTARRSLSVNQISSIRQVFQKPTKQEVIINQDLITFLKHVELLKHKVLNVINKYRQYPLDAKLKEIDQQLCKEIEHNKAKRTNENMNEVELAKKILKKQHRKTAIFDIEFELEKK